MHSRKITCSHFPKHQPAPGVFTSTRSHWDRRSPQAGVGGRVGRPRAQGESVVPLPHVEKRWAGDPPGRICEGPGRKKRGQGPLQTLTSGWPSPPAACPRLERKA